MIQIYHPLNKNFEMNGEVLHPIRCKASFVLNGVWDIILECPFNPAVVENAVLSVPTPYGRKQLYRLAEVEKDDDFSYAVGYPIFLDAKNECFLFDVRPTDKNGQEALDIMTNETKFSASSNIIKRDTSYFINKNLIEALNGNDDNSFINRWGGEIAYNNYQIIVNERLGSDNGLKVKFGFNLNGIKEYCDMKNVVTSIIPIAFNGRMLPDKETVNSPLINNYPIPFIKKYTYEDIKYIDDIEENEDITNITVCSTLDELYAALRERASLEYIKGIDKPSISYEVSIVDISKTDIYKNYKHLTTVNLGDTVHCLHKRLNIETEARVIEMTYDCILEEIEELKLGDYVPTYFDRMTDNTVVIDKVIDKDTGTLLASYIKGVIDLMNVSLKAQRDTAQKQNVRAILFEDTDPYSPTFGATAYGTAGLEFTRERNETNTGWLWNNTAAFGPHGLVANAIITGILSDKLGNFYLDLDKGKAVLKDALFSGKVEGSSFSTAKTTEYTYTENDKTIVQNLIMDESPPTAEQLAKYDLDLNGLITARDYVRMVNILNGKYGDTGGKATFVDKIAINLEGSGKIVTERYLNGTRVEYMEFNAGSIVKSGDGSIMINGEPVITEISGTIARFG